MTYGTPLHPLGDIDVPFFSSKEGVTGVYYSIAEPTCFRAGLTYRVASISELWALSTSAVLCHTCLVFAVRTRLCSSILVPRHVASSQGETHIPTGSYSVHLSRRSLSSSRSGWVSLPFVIVIENRTGLACSSWLTIMSLNRVFLSGHFAPACLVHLRSARGICEAVEAYRTA